MMRQKKRRTAGRAPGPRRGTKANLAADEIRARIQRGEYAIGQPLRELELSRSLGISRIPLREALHRLEAEGMVVIRPNRGAAVAGLSESELVEIAEACCLLECSLLHLALPALSVKILDEAEELLVRLDEIEDASEWARVNWCFHTTLYAPSGRPLQLELLQSLRARAQRAMLVLVAEKKRRLALNREHRAILALIRKKRAREAVDLLERHLQGGKNTVSRLLNTS